MAVQVRADDLPRLSETLRRISQSAQLGILKSHHLIVDASFAVAVARYKARLPDHTVRGHLEELVASGLVVAYAPTLIEQEVPAKLEAISAREPLPLDRMMDAWKLLRKRIRICAVGDRVRSELEAIRARDPDDLAYCQLYDDLEADAILSGDFDYTDAPVRVLDRDEGNRALGALKRHARAEAVVRNGQINMGSATAVGLGVTRELYRGYRRLPQAVQAAIPIALAAGLAIYLWKPERRAKAKEWLAKTTDLLGEGVRELYGEAIDAWANARTQSEEAIKSVHLILAPPRRPTVRAAAIRAVVAADAPMRLSAIGQCLQRQGYSAEEIGSSVKLRRHLVGSSNIVQLRDRRWIALA